MSASTEAPLGVERRRALAISSRIDCERGSPSSQAEAARVRTEVSLTPSTFSSASNGELEPPIFLSFTSPLIPARLLALSTAS